MWFFLNPGHPLFQGLSCVQLPVLLSSFLPAGPPYRLGLLSWSQRLVIRRRLICKMLPEKVAGVGFYFVELRSRVCMTSSFHSLRCDVIGPICRYIPFHIEKVVTTAIVQRWRFCSAEEKKSRSRICIVHVLLSTRERSIICRLRREANPDHWIWRRTVFHCTSRPRLFWLFIVPLIFLAPLFQQTWGLIHVLCHAVTGRGLSLLWRFVWRPK